MEQNQLKGKTNRDISVPTPTAARAAAQPPEQRVSRFVLWKAVARGTLSIQHCLDFSTYNIMLSPLAQYFVFSSESQISWELESHLLLEPE